MTSRPPCANPDAAVETRPLQALDRGGSGALYQQRQALETALAAHRARAPWRRRPQVSAPPRTSTAPAVDPRWLLALAAGAGGAAVALRPWRLMRRGVRWLAPVVSLELRALAWRQLKASVSAVLRAGHSSSDGRGPP